MNPKLSIGIIGGMGPQASANFYNSLVFLSAKKYGAIQDYEYPRILLYNLPLNGFTEEGIESEDLVFEQLILATNKMLTLGADFIVMICNTVHFFYDKLQNLTPIPIISIIEETVNKVKESGIHKVGILSSQSTRDLGLYESSLYNVGLKTLLTTQVEQELVNKVILKVMANKQSDIDHDVIIGISKRMIKDGANGIILGCTELPLAIVHDEIKFTLFNPNIILAEKALELSYNGLI